MSKDVFLVSPHFIIVGPQRTGTSWLDRVLRKHPNVRLPHQVKEAYYFERHEAPDIASYLGLFKTYETSDLTVVGEVSPTYFHQPKVAQRIAILNAQCKIIISVRDSVDRAESLIAHHVAKGRIPFDLDLAIKKFPEIIEAGHFSKYIPLWQRIFGIENVLVLDHEHIGSKPQAVIDKITDFLGIESIALEQADTGKYNQRTQPRYVGIAKLFAIAARVLRKMGLHSIAEWGKKMGLKNVYTGGNNTRPVLSTQERERLEIVFKKDKAWLLENDPIVK